MQIKSTQARAFWEQYSKDREIIREFFKRVPEEKLDFRMVDRPSRKSDSPRESLAHIIDTTRDYVNGVKQGELKFGIIYPDLKNPQKLSKKQLLEKLEKTEKQLFKLLCDPKIEDKNVKVPWSKEPVPAISCLGGLDSHEILHQGWNLALMDHLEIERFPALRRTWG